MATFAQIVGGVVTSLVCAPSRARIPVSGTWVDIGGIDPPPNVGWAYDGSNFAPPGLRPAIIYRDGPVPLYHHTR